MRLRLRYSHDRIGNREQEAHMKILLTGFEPFGGERINPALEAVRMVKDRIGQAEIVKLEVPVVFGKSIRTAEDAILRVKPDAVLCVGQAGGRSEMTVERVAINLDDAGIADNEGFRPVDSIIMTDGAPAYFSTLPVKAMIAAMRKAGIPAAISNSAGTYVCNHLMYGVLYTLDRHLPQATGGFIHVPYVPEQAVHHPGMPSMSAADIVRGLEAAITAISEKRKDPAVPEGKLY